MPSKQVLNRQVQLLEESLQKLRKAHNKIIDDINNINCPECRAIKLERAKRNRRKFNMLSATFLGAITPTDYSQEPHKLFEREVE